MLWRALKSVENGFYIDIGAQDPVMESVSMMFYEKGWRGIHVEPCTEYAEKLRAARPDEIVLQVAVDDSEGDIEFFEIPGTGISTGDSLLAQKYEEDGWPVHKKKVASLPLSNILDQAGNREVHWLKIDVEGMEKQVVSSWGQSKVRPWIVIVESTRPNSQEPSHELWEFMLINSGYDYVYFDGLNRFYIAQERIYLNVHFKYGPCVFDQYISYELKTAREQIEKLCSHQETARFDNQSAGLEARSNHKASKSLEAKTPRHFSLNIPKYSHELYAALRGIAHRQRDLSRFIRRWVYQKSRTENSYSSANRHYSEILAHSTKYNEEILSPRAFEIYKQLSKEITIADATP